MRVTWEKVTEIWKCFLPDKNGNSRRAFAGAHPIFEEGCFPAILFRGREERDF
jgi:hypothetical protein